MNKALFNYQNFDFFSMCHACLGNGRVQWPLYTNKIECPVCCHFPGVQMEHVRKFGFLTLGSGRGGAV